MSLHLLIIAVVQSKLFEPLLDLVDRRRRQIRQLDRVTALWAVDFVFLLRREVAPTGAAVALKPEVTPGERLANIVLVTAVAPPLLDDDSRVSVALAAAASLDLRGEHLITRVA